MSTTQKTNREWLLHFPPDIRERVREQREEYIRNRGNWYGKHISLYQSLYYAFIGTEEAIRQDPYWDDVFRRVHAGEFDQPWVEPEPTPEPTIYERFPIGSKWLMEVTVRAHDDQDEEFPIELEGIQGFDSWASTDELATLKRLKD